MRRKEHDEKPDLSLVFDSLAVTFVCSAQTFSSRWEELTAPDFVKALDQSKGVCLLPFGIIEKHAPRTRWVRT